MQEPPEPPREQGAQTAADADRQLEPAATKAPLDNISDSDEYTFDGPRPQKSKGKKRGKKKLKVACSNA